MLSRHILSHQSRSLAHQSTVLQELSGKDENKDVVFLKVDVDEAAVSALTFHKCLPCPLLVQRCLVRIKPTTPKFTERKLWRLNDVAQ